VNAPAAGRRRLHLAVDLRTGAEAPGVTGCGDLVLLAERGVLDFVVLPGVELLAPLAARTRRIGLVSAGPERAFAGLDAGSRGRAGWWHDPGEPARTPSAGRPVTVVEASAAGFGTAAAVADVALVAEAAPEQLAEARAELRRLATGRGRDPDSLRVLAALCIDLGGGEHAARPGHGGGVLRTGEGPLYRGGPVGLAGLVADGYRSGAADGFHLTPLDPTRDLERLVNATVPLLQHRALFRTFYPGGTLREHLGLPAAAPNPV
jgi:alkanesulfonate monooxygenase SsuD/methylene tetrahydromethanopterin reductase-like flavin-dependent oxidoreductase (luciferase family)